MFIFRLDYQGWRRNHFSTKFNDFYVSQIRCKRVSKTPVQIVGVADEPIRRVYLSDITVDEAGSPNEMKFAKEVLFKQVDIVGIVLNSPTP